MRPEEYKLPKEKFNLVNENKKLHDKELVTKPVGYFKDAMYRFAKNKGSIFGAVVIGILVLYAIIAPIFSPYTVSYHDAYYVRTLPRVFTSENIDFLDGADNKTSNLATFLNYYSMGAETGHNAIKRQSYKYNEETDMYSYRLDSYESVGTVFMSSVSKSDYIALQDYQDRTGIQVIYPITEPSKRPVSERNKTNANYWYETVAEGGNDIPVNYSFNEDGTINIPNIYREYEKPLLNSSTSSQALINLEAKGSGYIVKLSNETNVIGYLHYEVEDDMNVTTVVSDASEASAFVFDSVRGTLTFTLNGHETSSLDGDYLFALPKVQGSSVEMVKTTSFSEDNYIPLKLYKDDVVVTSVNTEDTYTFAANRYSETINKYFVGSMIENQFSVAQSLTKSSSFTFEAAGANAYYMRMKDGKFTYLVNAKADGDNTVFERASNTVTASTTRWAFDETKKAIKVVVDGHTTASLDGVYYIALTRDAKGNGTIGLLDNAALQEENKDVLQVVDSAAGVVDEIVEGSPYYLFTSKTIVSNNYYYVDGTFKGDNYYSKMRAEGDGVYKYSYAIAKDGNRYEIRVNYHEYYKYYHKEILRDRIRDPFFLFGTTASGQDIFTCLASGARFSFFLAISVAVVNFLVGTIYGAIEGYYGGKTDMIMERIVEILSAVPFMIVITLLKYHMKGTSQALILFISFFLTGWIGMSGTVRMQFYRFKNQEYVLASRTLGAKDPRIMFKHIFPNSLGTIVTGSVLVIPGMIFSETSLSYLGIINLNSGNMTSVGTLLAAGQPYLVQAPHIILFPSIFISLLMLCFNLFGNGLRDAFNPSLRGVEE